MKRVSYSHSQPTVVPFHLEMSSDSMLKIPLPHQIMKSMSRRSHAFHLSLGELIITISKKSMWAVPEPIFVKVWGTLDETGLYPFRRADLINQPQQEGGEGIILGSLKEIAHQLEFRTGKGFPSFIDVGHIRSDNHFVYLPLYFQALNDNNIFHSPSWPAGCKAYGYLILVEKLFK